MHCTVQYKSRAGLVGPGSGPGPGLGYVSLYRQAACSHSHVVKTSMNLYSGVRTVGIAINDGLAWLSSWVVPAVTVCIAAQAASRLS